VRPLPLFLRRHRVRRHLRVLSTRLLATGRTLPTRLPLAKLLSPAPTWSASTPATGSCTSTSVLPPKRAHSTSQGRSDAEQPNHRQLCAQARRLVLEHVSICEALHSPNTDFCISYAGTETGIGPEVFSWQDVSAISLHLVEVILIGVSAPLLQHCAPCR
jgi:hypothetical protein